MPHAMMTEKLHKAPISGEYQEINFDISGIWKNSYWNWVKFITKDLEEWCGAFRSESLDNFLIAELINLRIVCVISGGHGYIINVDEKRKIKDLESSNIIDLISDQESNSFIITRCWDLKIIDEKFNELNVDLPIQANEIFLKEIKDRKLNLEIEKIGAYRSINKNYYLDLNDFRIKMHAVPSPTMDSADTSTFGKPNLI